jgi:hypothetical protein
MFESFNIILAHNYKYQHSQLKKQNLYQIYLGKELFPNNFFE